MLLASEQQEELGLELVAGKVRSGLGEVADGVFVRRITRGSPAEQDGRLVQCFRMKTAKIITTMF